MPSCERRGMLAAAEVLYPGPVIKPKSTRRKVLRFQRNAFQGYSTGKEHDCSTQHRSRRTEELGGVSKSPLGWALSQCHPVRTLDGAV